MEFGVVNIQLHENLYIYEVLERQSLRWISVPILAIDIEVADMLIYRRFRSQYRLVKTVLGGCRRRKARLLHVRQISK